MYVHFQLETCQQTFSVIILTHISLRDSKLYSPAALVGDTRAHLQEYRQQVQGTLFTSYRAYK
jgi:hypothetical protein